MSKGLSGLVEGHGRGRLVAQRGKGKEQEQG